MRRGTDGQENSTQTYTCIIHTSHMKKRVSLTKHSVGETKQVHIFSHRESYKEGHVDRVMESGRLYHK